MPKALVMSIDLMFIALAVLLLAALAVFITMIKKEKSKKNGLEKDDEIVTTIPVEGVSPIVLPDHHGITIGNAQHIGARETQQDSFGISNNDEAVVAHSGLLAVVADGMGGLSNGAVFSKAAVQGALRSFQNEPPEKNDGATLLRVLKRAREAVAETNLDDGGTTFVAVLIRNQELHFISVGDSRISLMRNGGIIQLNREHVYGRELDDLAVNGVLSENEAEHDRQRAALTSYIGKMGELAIDRNINPIPLYSGDKVILSSDGVDEKFISEAELTALLRKEPMEAAEAVKDALIAKNNPKQDNLTLIVLGIN